MKSFFRLAVNMAGTMPPGRGKIKTSRSAGSERRAGQPGYKQPAETPCSDMKNPGIDGSAFHPVLYGHEERNKTPNTREDQKTYGGKNAVLEGRGQSQPQRDDGGQAGGGDAPPGGKGCIEYPGEVSALSGLPVFFVRRAG